MNREPLSVIVTEEIALEGLEGITIEGLWTRISIRMKITKPLNENFCNQIWTFIKQQTCFKYYLLPEEREILRTIDRFAPEMYDAEMGIAIEPVVIPHTTFNYVPIESGNIRGSCEHFHTRVEIPLEDILNLNVSDVENNYGRKFVICGSQQLRESVLIPKNVDHPNELTIIPYCILERVGRSRGMGEITLGCCSLQKLGRDAKTFHYFTKRLFKQRLMVKQPYVQKIKGTNTTGTILHLPRFYSEFKPKHMILTEKVVEILKERPNCMASYEEVKAEIGYNLRSSMKRLFKSPDFQRFVNTDLRVPYRHIYPDADIREWKMKVSDDEKSIRVVQLIDPNVNISEMWYKNDEEVEEVGLLDPSQISITSSLLRDAIALLDEAKHVGLSQSEIQTKLGIDMLAARSVLKSLTKLKYIQYYMQDHGRQRMAKNALVKYMGVRKQEYGREENKILQLGTANTSSELDDVPTVIDETQIVMGDTTILSTSTLATDEISNSTSPVAGTSAESVAAIEQSPIVDDDVTTGIQLQDIAVEVKELDHVPGMSKQREGYKRGDDNLEMHLKYSTRTLKRVNFVIQTIKQNLVLGDLSKLLKLIMFEEKKQGHNDRICKKSLVRILGKIVVDGYIKLYEIVLKYKQKFRSILLVCDPSIDKNHTRIKSFLDQAILKFIVNLRPPKAREKPKTGLVEKLNPINVVKYGFSPKFIRMKILHDFLYYLIYGYPTDRKIIAKEVAIAEWKKTQGCVDEKELLNEISNVYSLDIGWKMFVPPMFKHRDMADGWAMYGDVLIRMPLSIFIKIYNLTEQLTEIEEVMAHPIRKHYLLKDLSPVLQEKLIKNRKYIFRIDDIIKLLCFVGLAQYGPQQIKDKEHMYLYLNRRASLLNTVTTDPAYFKVTRKEYERLQYEFNTQEDIEKYWSDLWAICHNTRLGSLKHGDDRDVEKLETKPILVKSLAPRSNDEAIERDNGTIPGDNLGAGGYDSAMFAHIKKNWVFSTVKKKSPPNPLSLKARVTRLESLKPKSVTFKKFLRDRETLSTFKHNEKRHVVPIPKQQPIARKIIRNYSKTVRNKKSRLFQYDAVDQLALRKMNKLRVEWTAAEDNILLLCKVGLLYFSTKGMAAMHCRVIRDILHWKMKAINKTGPACRRRISYMLKTSSSTSKSVNLCVEEVRENTLIRKRYGDNFNDGLKKMYPNEADYVNAFSVHFMDLMLILIKHFTNLTPSKDVIQEIPDDLAAFKRDYTLVKSPDDSESSILYRNGMNKAEVELTTIYSMIHSSMCCTRDKTLWSIQLFDVYKNYSEKLMADAMKTLRAHLLLSINKLTTQKKFKSQYHPYHLSLSYQLQITTKLPYELIDEYYRQLVDIKNQNDFVEFSTTNHGICFLMVELHANRRIDINLDIPKKVLNIDVQSNGDDPMYERICSRFDQMYGQCTSTAQSSVSPLTSSSTTVGHAVENKKNRKVSFNLETDKIFYNYYFIERLEKLPDEYLHLFCILINTTTKVFHYTGQQNQNICSTNCIFQKSNYLDIAVNLIKTNYAYIIREEKNLERNLNKLLEKSKRVEMNVKDFGRLTGLKQLYPTIFELVREYETIFEKDDDEFEEMCDVTDWTKNYWRNTIYDDEDDGVLVPRWSEINKELDNQKDEMEHMRRLHNCFSVKTSKISVRMTPPANEETILSEDEEKTIVNNMVFMTGSLPQSICNKDEAIERFRRQYLWPSEHGSIIDFHNKMLETKMTPTEIQMGMDVLACIEESAVKGITVAALKLKFDPPSSLLKIIQILIDVHLILKSGVDKITLVFWMNIQPWVVNSYHVTRLERERIEKPKTMPLIFQKRKYTPDSDVDREELEKAKRLKLEIRPPTQPLPDNQPSTSATAVASTSEAASEIKKEREIIQIIPVPWIRINGSLNRRVLDRYLGAILLHCISFPGIVIKDLLKKFKYLYPVHLRNLLELLENVECIKLWVIRKQKQSLFDEYSKPVLERATILDAFEETFVEVATDAIFKLSMLIGDKKYKLEFI